MKVVHLEDERWDSGLASYALALAREQARRGWAVSFWGREGSPPLAAAAAAGLSILSWPGSGWLSLPRLRRAAEDADLLVAHTGSAHALAAAVAAGGRAAVVRVRADARPARARPFSRLLAGRTAAFLAANSSLEASLREAFPEALVRRVPQGLEGPAAPPPLPAEPAAGIVARLDPVKGHATLLEACALLAGSLPGLRLLVAGEGRLSAELRERARSLGLGERVSFLGRIPDRDAALASCRAGIVCSLGSEAVSRSALEWMAAGRAVVASRVGGLPDLVEDGDGGLLVPPGDPRALAEALGRLLAEPGLAEAQGAAARRRWERLFSPGRFFEATAEAYREALARHPR